MHHADVLHVIKTLRLGGAEANLVNMVRVADRKRFRMHIAYSYGGEFEASLKALDGVRLFKYAEKPHKVKSPASALIIARLAAYILRHRIRVVHTHTFNAHVWGSLAAKLCGAHVVEHVHDSRYEDPSYLRHRGVDKPQQYLQADRFARLSDRIVVLTHNNRAHLLRAGLDDSRVFLVRNGIALNGIPARNDAAVRQRYAIAPEQRIVLAAGRLSPEKNPAFIVDIADCMRKLRGDVVFLVAGSGPEEGRMRVLIEHLKLERGVRLIGFHGEVSQLLQAAEVFILPSLLELHSITMLEAMRAGVPVLASRAVGCNSDFITDGVDGFLLDPYQPEPWARTIHDLLDDPERARRVGSAGRRLVERECDLDKTIRRFERLYLQLMRQKRDS